MKNNLSPIYEKLHIGNDTLPVYISLRENTNQSTGSTFNWHEAIEIYYIIQGSLTLNTNCSLYHLNEGDIGIIGWGIPHRGFNFSNYTKHYIIQVDTQAIPQLNNYPKLRMPKPLANIIIKNNKEAAQILDKAIMHYMNKEKFSELDALASILRFFSLVLKLDNQSPSDTPEINKDSLEHIHKMLHYMNNHFLEPITLEKLSKGLGLSKSYMCRLFKKHIGQTIVHHINERRCNYAAALITQGTSLQEAAYLSGFSDYNYFSRTFKQITGRRPSDNTITLS